MNNTKIERVDELVAQYVGPNKKIIEKKASSLTAPGENYWSSMVKLDLVLKDQATSEEEDLHAVAKCVISNNGPAHFEKMGLLNFRNEIAFYKEIIPALKDFQKEQGMLETKIFPELYAARYNLHGLDSEVDKNAVLILENLKTKGNLL